MAIRNRSNAAKWNIFFHMSAMLVTSVSGLITLPIYLSHIDIAIYGAWLATGNIIAWATMVDPGLSAVTQQQVAAAYGAKDLALVGKRACVGISLNCGISFILACAASVLVIFIPNLLSLDDAAAVDMVQLQQAGWIAAAGLFFNVGAFAITASNLALLGSVFIGVVYLFSMISTIILQIYLVMSGWGILGIALASFLRGAILFIGSSMYLCYRFMQEKIRFTFDMEEARQTLGLTGFTFMSKATGAVADNLDSFLLVRLLSPEAAAILRATKAPFSMCIGLTNRPSAAVAPILSNIAGSGELEQKQGQILRLLLFSLWVSVLSFVGLLVLLESFMGLWVGPGFYAGHATLWVLSFSLLALSGSAFVVNMAFAIGQIKNTALITMGKALISVVSMAVFGYFFGIAGVAAGGGIGALFAFIVAARMLAKSNALTKKTLSIFARQSALTALAGAMVFALRGWLLPVHGWIDMAVDVVCVTSVFALILLLFSGVFRSEVSNAAMVGIHAVKRRLA